MFCPHRQNIRKSKEFQRDGPHVARLNLSKELSPRKIWPGQCISTETKKLDQNNSIIIHNNFLEESERIRFIQESFKHEKQPSVHHDVLNFTRNGKSYTGREQPVTHFKDHVLNISQKILNVHDSEHSLLDYATEYSYGTDIVDGGSLTKTNDPAFGLVGFFALGQTRFLRLTKESARGYINIPLYDNSLILFTGDNFQKNYLHQIDTLPAEVPSGLSTLLKVRFRKPVLSGTSSRGF